jgi:hypothetical protein
MKWQKVDTCRFGNNKWQKVERCRFGSNNWTLQIRVILALAEKEKRSFDLLFYYLQQKRGEQL